MGHTRYLKLNWLSTFFIFMLFVIGGLVRSTGSGMGCPDWPKCFGEYVPPTSVAELPLEYEDFFKVQRIKKTKRFAALLRSFGMEDKAEQILNNSDLEETHQFNVVKAYVEYINRLWGAITGIIVLMCFLFSLKYIRQNPKVFWLTLLGLVFVFFNALLGAVVVNSNLIGGIVTVHFIAAFASICFFILARRYAAGIDYGTIDSKLKTVSILLLALSSIQVILGAEVRELYDLLPVLSQINEKIEAMYPTFQWHAVLGAVILAVSIYQFIYAGKSTFWGKNSRWIMVMAMAQIIWGPLALIEATASTSKLFHISLGAGIFVLQFYICTSFLKSAKQAT